MSDRSKAQATRKPTQGQRDLESGQRDLESVTPGLAEQWVNLHRRRPRYLYHYTNAQGLLGMLQSNRIWATNSRFMNDPTEIAYATRLVREVMALDWPEKGTGGWKQLMDSVAEFLNEYESNAKVYIACFCAQGDLLSQWRGYGAVGGGYALGFSARNLGAREVTSFDKPEPILRKVIYERRTQERLVGDWLKGLSALEQARRENPRHTRTRQLLNDAWGTFNMFLSECLNCFKDPAYREEQEWRLIQFGRVFRKDVFKASFRTGGARIVPYVELDCRTKRRERGKLPVKMIQYGPTLDPTVTERSLRLLCEAYGYKEDGLKIRRSGVPFSG